ncbi:hypothetical protein BC628DRAFT_1493054 [Trametes gibbosa]|nr:hypothetical protein BC628DRAFT_1493054 [Trametes gibbosa]
MPLQTLPDDVLLDIFQHLHVHDILSLRLTCRGLDMATRERTVWHEALTRHSFHSCLPIPHLRTHEYSELTARELERLTLCSLKFWSNWMSPYPKAYRYLSVPPARPVMPPRGARNLAAIFLPDCPNHILTLTLYDDVSHHRRYAFELWETADYSKPAHLLDQHSIQALLGYAVNTMHGSSCTMTISRRDPVTQQCVTEAYRIEVLHPPDGSHFRLVNQFPGYRNTIGLHGLHLIATDAEQDVRVIDIVTGRLEVTLKAPTMLNDPTLRFAERQCMDALIIDDFILTFCKQYIFLYHIPPRSNNTPEDPNLSQDVPCLEAVATYKWRWRIDTLVAKPRIEPSGIACRYSSAIGRPTHKAASAPLIDILIRFDTWFPWPVNILHHFVLAPNPAYRPRRAPATDLPSPGAAAHPYILSPQDGPVMVHSIPSPLRIFTPSDAVLSPYGTALWIDAATDGAAAQAGDHGQRVVGRVLTRGAIPGRPGARAGRGEGVHLGVGVGDDAVSPGVVVEGYGDGAAEGQGGEERGGEADGVRAEGIVGVRGVAVGADPTVYSGAAVSVFHAREDVELWNRVAVDEESGRVAVGQVDGTVTVYSYVPPPFE